jgi:hypothetical protein
MTQFLYEIGNYWVRAEQFGSGRFKPKSNGYGVYENGITHSVMKDRVCHDGPEGLKRAIAAADKRHKEQQAKESAHDD